MSIKIFLSGAIDYVGEYAKGWRQEAAFLLNQRGYKVVDPTSVAEDCTTSPEEIAQKNLFMQKRSDILLVEYMIQDRAYIGTDFEMAWAKIHGQPVVVICNAQYKERVYMRYMATKIVDNIEEAIEYISIHYPIN